jgi:hypothetical protein
MEVKELVKKLLLANALSAAIVAVPVAQAHPGPTDHPNHGKSHKCVQHKVGYTAQGLVTTVTLAQSAGTDTPNDSSDDRYSGTLTFDVKHQNHHAKGDAGNGNYALDNVRVKFADGLTAATVAAGDRVKVIGKITTVAKKCSDKSDAGKVTLRQVVVHQPVDSTGSEGTTG